MCYVKIVTCVGVLLTFCEQAMLQERKSQLGEYIGVNRKALDQFEEIRKSRDLLHSRLSELDNGAGVRV